MLAAPVTTAGCDSGGTARACPQIIAGDSVSVDARPYAASHPAAAELCANGQCRPMAQGAQPNLRHDGPDPVEITVTVTGAAGRVLLKAATTVTPHHSRTGCPADRTYHGQAMVAADGELRSK